MPVTHLLAIAWVILLLARKNDDVLRQFSVIVIAILLYLIFWPQL